MVIIGLFESIRDNGEKPFFITDNKTVFRSPYDTFQRNRFTQLRHLLIIALIRNLTKETLSMTNGIGSDALRKAYDLALAISNIHRYNVKSWQTRL